MSASRAKPASLIFTRTRSELANTARGSPLTPTTCSTEGLPGRNSARICQCHRHRLGRRDLAIEALVAPADFKSVKVRKPCREVAERAQAAPARLIRKGGGRNDEGRVISMTNVKNVVSQV